MVRATFVVFAQLITLAACAPAPAPGAGPASTRSGTPAPVDNSTREQSLAVRFDPERRIIHQPVELALSTSAAGARIRYTLDGSVPTATHGEVFAAPIPVASTMVVRAAAFTSGAAPGPVATHSYIFPERSAQQPAAPPGAPPRWADEPADYGMDPRAGDPERVAAALMALPSLSVALEPDDLFGAERGIYAHPLEEGADWERPASVELIPADGTAGFQADAGLRIQGGWGRRPDKSAKHSFRLLFKEKYGPKKLDYALFPDSPVEKHDTVVLRANFNDSWTVNVEGQRERALYLRDEWFRATHRAMGQPAPAGVLAHLYVNGLYWGLYNPTERPDGAYAAELFGGDEEDYDTLNSGEAVEGDTAAWAALLELSKGDIKSDAAYKDLAARLDLDNLVDYILLELYIGNQDWPKRNWYANRRREPGEPFRFFAWDGERGLEFVDRETEDPWQWATPAFLFARLLENPRFRERVAQRVAQHVGPGGALHVDPDQPAWDPARPAANVPAARFVALAEPLEGALLAESARWGDVRRPERPFGLAEWRAERDRLLAEYFPQRTAAFLVHLQSLGVPVGQEP